MTLRPPAPDENRTLAECYPEPRRRRTLHHAFVHRFFREYVQGCAPTFALRDFSDPALFIHERWWVMEGRLGLPPPTGPSIRRVADLQAWTEVLEGRQTLLVEMPQPEWPSCAFYVAGVTPFSPELIRQINDYHQAWCRGDWTEPYEGPLNSFDSIECRYFTLERGCGVAAEIPTRIGRFYEWTRAGERLDYGLVVPVGRPEFARAVAYAIQPGDPLPSIVPLAAPAFSTGASAPTPAPIPNGHKHDPRRFDL